MYHLVRLHTRHLCGVAAILAVLLGILASNAMLAPHQAAHADPAVVHVPQVNCVYAAAATTLPTGQQQRLAAAQAAGLSDLKSPDPSQVANLTSATHAPATTGPTASNPCPGGGTAYASLALAADAAYGHRLHLSATADVATVHAAMAADEVRRHGGIAGAGSGQGTHPVSIPAVIDPGNNAPFLAFFTGENGGGTATFFTETNGPCHPMIGGFANTYQIYYWTGPNPVRSIYVSSSCPDVHLFGDWHYQYLVDTFRTVGYNNTGYYFDGEAKPVFSAWADAEPGVYFSR